MTMASVGSGPNKADGFFGAVGVSFPDRGLMPSVALSLGGRTALVTGAATGIGRAIAARFAEPPARQSR